MKPFSAVYYVRENKWRAALLIFMFVLTFAIYLAGLYISNVECMFDYSQERTEHVAGIRPNQSDEHNEKFAKAVEELEEEEGVTVLWQGVVSFIYTKSVMNFHNGFMQYSFRNKEDLKTYCDFVGIKLQKQNKERELGNGSVIMSELQAANRGMKIGDKLVTGDEEYADQEYTLDAVTDEEGYTAYYISDTDNANCLILPTAMGDGEFHELLQQLEKEYGVYIIDHDYYEDTLASQLNSFHYIYFFIIVLISVIMAITINAAFVGMYQHRQGEFALYRAIGISRRKMRLKIAAEVLLLDICGLSAGACILMLGIYLANNLYLLEHGLRLFYYNEMSMVGMVLSNVIILVPVMFLQSARMMKADICNY